MRVKGKECERLSPGSVWVLASDYHAMVHKLTALLSMTTDVIDKRNIPGSEELVAACRKMITEARGDQ